MSSNSDVTTSLETNSASRLTGRVKWFNNKAGYGFVTITDGEKTGMDIFVHHSSINVENQQYKYLVQGEYVEFNLSKTTSGTHEWQASNVNGINSGKLMCETRRDFKLARNAYKTEKKETVVETTPVPRQQSVPPSNDAAPKQRVPRARGEGPREGAKKEWTLVSKKSDSKSQQVRSRAPRQGATVITIESK